jgi:hypothetical protein
MMGQRILRCEEHIWQKLGLEATARGMSRPKLAMEILWFMLENKDIIDELLADDDAIDGAAPG